MGALFPTINIASSSADDEQFEIGPEEAFPEEEIMEDPSDEPAPACKGLAARYGITDREMRNAAFAGDHGPADLFIKINRNQLIFDSDLSDWLLFDPTTGYSFDVNRQRFELLRVVAALFEDFAARIPPLSNGDEDPVVSAARSQIKRINSNAGTKAILDFAAAGNNSLARSGIPWDTAKFVFPFQNGLVDLRTGVFRPYRTTDYLTLKAPISYDPDADCPKFKAAIMDALDNDQEMYNYIQTSLGYAICRVPSEEKVFVYKGKAGNSKGLLLESIQAACGDLMTPMPIEKFLKQINPPNPDSPSASTLLLRGKMLCITSEPNEGAIFGTGKLKELSGGNYLTARAPYGKKNITFHQTHTIIIETNYTIHVSAEDEGAWRPLRLVEWPVQYVENPKPNNPLERKRDDGLKQYIKDNELPGIVNWLIEGTLKWFKGIDGTGLHPKLVTPQKVIDATAAYRRSEDDLQDFIDECLKTDATDEERTSGVGDNYHCSKIYGHYQQWAKAQGYSASKMLKAKSFGAKLRNKLANGCAVDALPRDSGGNYYNGVIIKNVDRFISDMQ